MLMGNWFRKMADGFLINILNLNLQKYNFFDATNYLNPFSYACGWIRKLSRKDFMRGITRSL